MAAVVSLRVVVGGERGGAIVGQRPGGIKKKKKASAAWRLTAATPRCWRSCCAIFPAAWRTWWERQRDRIQMLPSCEIKIFACCIFVYCAKKKSGLPAVYVHNTNGVQ